MIQQAFPEAMGELASLHRGKAWRTENRPMVGGWDAAVSASILSIRPLARPRSSRSVDVGAEFRRLRQQWQEETMWTSSSTDMILHPAYQMIIGLGPDAIPYILADLKKEPDHWGWALRSITRQDPVPSGCEGDIVAIAAAWLAWGREHGLA